MTQREVLCGISTVAPHEEGVLAGTFGAIVTAACAGTRATDNILRARTMEAQEPILKQILEEHFHVRINFGMGCMVGNIATPINRNVSYLAFIVTIAVPFAQPQRKGLGR
jgi:hypothetical protein